MIGLRTEETQRTKVAEKKYFKKLSTIKERFKAIERVDLYDQIKLNNICFLFLISSSLENLRYSSLISIITSMLNDSPLSVL